MVNENVSYVLLSNYKEISIVGTITQFESVCPFALFYTS